MNYKLVVNSLLVIYGLESDSGLQHPEERSVAWEGCILEALKTLLLKRTVAAPGETRGTCPPQFPKVGKNCQ